MKSGNGKWGLEILPTLWSSAYATTEGGRKVRLIDPFLYSGRARIGDKSVGGYYNKPEHYRKAEVKEVKDPARADTDILHVAVAPEGYGVKKEFTVAVEKGANVAYVYNRLTALQDLTLLRDVEYFYHGRPQHCRIMIDGAQHDADNPKGAVINEYISLFDPKGNYTYAVIFLDRKVQDFPKSDKRYFGRFYYGAKRPGRDFNWDKGTGKMAAGTSRSQQYMLLWGDGDLSDTAAELSRKALGGEFNVKVHVLK